MRITDRARVPADQRQARGVSSPALQTIEATRRLGFRRIDSCLDYRTFVHPLPADLTAEAFDALREELRRLGDPRDEWLGVVYVYADWGFFVLPPRGFPELRVSFYHAARSAQQQRILTRLSESIERSVEAPPSQGVASTQSL